MDVSATGQAAPAAATGVVTGTAAPSTPAPTTAPATAPVTGAQTKNGSSTPGTTATQTGDRAGLAPAIAKLFGNASPPEPIRLDVSYRVLQDPTEIVTVFSDPSTGQEVAQFSSDILIGLASFFDQQRGVTLDRDV